MRLFSSRTAVRLPKRHVRAGSQLQYLGWTALPGRYAVEEFSIPLASSSSSYQPYRSVHWLVQFELFSQVRRQHINHQQDLDHTSPGYQPLNSPPIQHTTSTARLTLEPDRIEPVSSFTTKVLINQKKKKRNQPHYLSLFQLPNQTK